MQYIKGGTFAYHWVAEKHYWCSAEFRGVGEREREYNTNSPKSKSATIMSTSVSTFLPDSRPDVTVTTRHTRHIVKSQSNVSYVAFLLLAHRKTLSQHTPRCQQFFYLCLSVSPSCSLNGVFRSPAVPEGHAAPQPTMGKLVTPVHN